MQQTLVCQHKPYTCTLLWKQRRERSHWNPSAYWRKSIRGVQDYKLIYKTWIPVVQEKVLTVFHSEKKKSLKNIDYRCWEPYSSSQCWNDIQLTSQTEGPTPSAASTQSAKDWQQQVRRPSKNSNLPNCWMIIRVSLGLKSLCLLLFSLPTLSEDYPVQKSGEHSCWQYLPTTSTILNPGIYHQGRHRRQQQPLCLFTISDQKFPPHIVQHPVSSKGQEEMQINTAFY